MADLSIQEKAKIEKFLGMGSGYVADFSDRTFQEFVGAVTGLDIDDPKYHYSSNSKANRLSLLKWKTIILLESFFKKCLITILKS
ncbi:hypothetical protein [Flavobacterium sp. HBTb2-11-1]|uniref:hypothetical protein n=1 Tax=Flavobacterium sp. HBTb2-11-1 TaxID=2692212 RepID=UPI001927501C|nr:hypothetical protein [Flavobacterium sp. HBTb2-11-1]